MKPGLGYQRGAALLLVCMIWMMLLAGWWLWTWTQDASEWRGIRQQQWRLQQIRQSLLDAIASDDAGSVLGTAFAPDILLSGASHGVGDYGVCLNAQTPDGLPLAKYGVTATVYPGLRCIGRLPVRDSRLPVASAMWQGDPTGMSIWYAVSPNVLDVASDPASPGGACLNKLNAEVLSQNPGAAKCQQGALPYPWFVIRGPNGTVMTDQAVIVLAASGRTFVPRTGSWTQLNRLILAEYLDKVRILPGNPLAEAGSYDNAGLSLDWIQAPLRPPVSPVSIYDMPYQFNDQLVWITRQELVDRLVWHVMQVMAHDLAYPFPENRPALDAQHPSAPGKMNRWTRLEKHWGDTFQYQKLADDHAQVRISGCQSVFDLFYELSAITPGTRLRKNGSC